MSALTWQESALLAALKQRRGLPVSFHDLGLAIHTRVHLEPIKLCHLLKALVSRVRKHLGPSERIESIRGFGYCFMDLSAPGRVLSAEQARALSGRAA